MSAELAPTRRNLSPVWALVLNVLCITAAEIFLKLGAGQTHPGLLGFSALSSWQTIVGILFHVSGFACWMFALRTLPVSLAFNFTALAQVLVPIAAFVFLGETISPLRCGGIGLVIAGFVLLVPVVARVEEKTDA